MNIPTQRRTQVFNTVKNNEIVFRILLTAITGCIAWIWIYHLATTALPFGYTPPVAPEELPDYFWDYQKKLLIMAWPMAVVVAISSNFLASAFIRTKRHISKWGYVALAWPLIDFLPVSVVGFLYVPILVGPIVALVVSGITVAKQKYWGNLLSLAWSLIWMSVALAYVNRLWDLVGD